MSDLLNQLRGSFFIINERMNDLESMMRPAKQKKIGVKKIRRVRLTVKSIGVQASLHVTRQ